MQGQSLGAYIDLVRKLPPPPTMRLVGSMDEARCMRCACGNVKDKRDMPVKHSGFIPYHDIICPGCIKSAAGTATVVCSSCREVIGKVPAGKDSKDGFVFTAGKTYHVVRCDRCASGMDKVEIVERILHRQRNNLPNPLISSQSGT